jgi:hypothetical protein
MGGFGQRHRSACGLVCDEQVASEFCLPYPHRNKHFFAGVRTRPSDCSSDCGLQGISCRHRQSCGFAAVRMKSDLFVAWTQMRISSGNERYLGCGSLLVNQTTQMDIHSESKAPTITILQTIPFTPRAGSWIRIVQAE